MGYNLPANLGAPDWSRTSGLQSRSLMLYPTELRAQISFLYYNTIPFRLQVECCRLIDTKFKEAARGSDLLRLCIVFFSSVEDEYQQDAGNRHGQSDEESRTVCTGKVIDKTKTGVHNSSSDRWSY